MIEWIAVLVLAVALLGLLLPYVIYPAWLRLRVGNTLATQELPAIAETMPHISVLLPVHNEAQVIAARIHNIYDTLYPSAAIEVVVGLDACTDGSLAVLEQLQSQYPNLRWVVSNKRIGKGAMLNQLAAAAAHNLLVFTDGRAAFVRHTLPCLVAPLLQQGKQCISGWLATRQTALSPVGKLERAHQRRESWMKWAEGKWVGQSIGVFGPCYALLRAHYKPVPTNVINDDLWQGLAQAQAGRSCRVAPAALCYHSVPTEAKPEFERKRRIMAGNFQLLFRCWRQLCLPWSGLAWLFWLHKGLKWLTPLLLWLAVSALLLLGLLHLPLVWVWFVLATTFGLGLLSLMATALRWPIAWLQQLYHILQVQLAIVAGLWQAIRGMRQASWPPTRRPVV